MLLFFSSISCSKSNSETEDDYFADFERVEQLKIKNIGSDTDLKINYYFDSNNNYSSFIAQRRFSEVYNEPDSLVVDGVQGAVRVIRRSLKFNKDNIIVYTYDLFMKYVEKKTVIYFNENKIITRIENFYNSNEDSYGFIGTSYTVFFHDAQNNITKVEEYLNNNNLLIRDSPPDWRKGSICQKFDFLDYSFPSFITIQNFVPLPSAFAVILYNKGYWYSNKGIKGYEFVFIDFHENLNSKYNSLQIQPRSKFEYDVKYFEDSYNSSNYNVNFKVAK